MFLYFAHIDDLIPLQVFKKTTFRSVQRQVIEAALEGHDVYVDSDPTPHTSTSRYVVAKVAPCFS